MNHLENEEQKAQKPISEMLYRIISLFLVLIAFLAATIATILRIPPAHFIKNTFHLGGEEGSMVLWLIFFIFFVIICGIILRLLKPYSNVPKNPYGELNITTFFKGDAEQDEYKINDKN